MNILSKKYCLPQKAALSLAVAVILGMTACSGGGGRKEEAPDVPPPIPPMANTCTDPSSSNTGIKGICDTGYVPPPPPAPTSQYGNDAGNLLVRNGVVDAYNAGFTGQGVSVGMVGTALNAADKNTIINSPLSKQQHIRDEAMPEFTRWKGNDPDLHLVADSIYLAGRNYNSFKGGIAPDVQLRWFGLCSGNLHIDCNQNTLGQTSYYRALESLLDKDIRLISFSTNGISTNQNHWQNSDWQLLKDHNALLVASAGDNNRNQPREEWRYPATNKDYYGNFIVATALHVGDKGSKPPDGSTGKDLGISHAYSVYRSNNANKCGEAAYWCVGAVVNAAIPDPANSNKTTTDFADSSAASAVVTGVAALVMQAYPWMSAANIQQTVLTTATHPDAAKNKDASELSKDYGWGIVNAGKAINGPAQFIRNEKLGITDFEVDFTGGSRPFSNDISGSGGLIKRGDGTLTLSGKNSYSGGTRVEAGTLRLADGGRIGSEDKTDPGVKVSPGALFMTGGTKGAVTIDGNYNATNGAITAIKLDAPLNINGTATINGGDLLLLRPENGYSPVGGKATLLTTNNGNKINGRFNNIHIGEQFFWKIDGIDYTNTTVVARLTATNVQAQAMTFNASNSVLEGAKIADTLIGYTQNLINSGQSKANESLIAATAQLMSAPDNETAMQSLSSLNGEIHATRRTLNIQRALDGGEQLAQRLRTSQTGVWFHQVSANKDLNRNGYAQTNIQHHAFGIGSAMPLSDSWTVGISIVRTDSSAKAGGFGGQLSGYGQQVALYARSEVGQRGYISSVLSYDWHKVETQRQVLAGTQVSRVVGQHADNSMLMRLENGLQLRNGFAPYLAVGALALHQGAFSETGLLGFSANADTFRTRFGELGARFDRQFGRWNWASRASIQRMIGGESGFTAAFVGAEAAPFTVASQNLSTTRMRWSSDVRYHTVNGWQLSFGMGMERGSAQQGSTWAETAARLHF